MAYTVLARRYRSQTFDDVVGQDAVAQTLKNAIKSGRVAHAYLFSGTRGVGKTTMARILAKALNCLEADEPTTEPCCKCDSCVSINAGDDIDVIEIDGASNTGVDNIRQLRQNAIYRPARARFKIYIIDEVHMLSTGAFNALLKILEEPPEHVKFIFATTEPNKVLPTIQSRCQRFDFVNISPADISKQLAQVLKSEKIKFEKDLILHLARLANGSMRDGLSILDQLLSTGADPVTVALLKEFMGEPDNEKLFDLIDKIGDNDAAGVLAAVDHLLKTGITPSQIVDSLINSMRDLMVLKSTKPDSDLLILTAQERENMSRLAQKFDTPALIYNITTMEKLRWTIKNSESARALLEASILRLALSEHFLGVPQLLSQIGSGTKAVVSAPVKKNSIAPAPVNNHVSTPAENKPKSVAAPEIDSDDIESIKSAWPRIVEALKNIYPGNAGAIDPALPTAYQNGQLTLTFPETAAFAKTRCANRIEQLTTEFSNVLGSPVKLKLTTDSIHTPASARPPGAKISQAESDKALNDPAVRKIISGLNATVTHVEEIERQS